MREYVTRVLWWVDVRGPCRGGHLDRPDFEGLLENLREDIAAYEMRRMFNRLADGEDWAEIRRSGQGGRWE